MQVAVMGAGSWGTVFSMILADAGCDVVLWTRSSEIVAEVNNQRTNSLYHSDLKLPANICATADAQEALKNSELVVLALPSQTLRSNLADWGSAIDPDAVVVSLIKGIELGTSLRMSEVISEVAGISMDRIAVVSGPNLAHEIAAREPAATTVACVNEDSARKVQDACTTEYFRPYYTTDLLGVELAGALKNVIALANGMAVGLGYGENSQAAIMTRGLAELARLGVALGAHPYTFSGLSGVGDLIATCQSPLSRNRTIGVYLGEGLTIAEAEIATKTTSEGVKSCGPLLELARRYGVEMPITEQVVNVIHHGKSPHEVLQAFMARSTRSETGHREHE
ncbi:MAG: NAD(P)-dependent glycerol-3-phosphate dehydrogenase [Actinomycetales bacterium]|nr:NAD(P)-dependent glycerol-3-phosphate dehydrogenase [Actinomycetales bacterium]